MNPWKQRVALIGLVALTALSAGAEEPIRLRLLSYNIHHGEGIDRKLDLQRIATVILSVKPDIVALQEVDQNTARTGNVDQANELARLTKMNVVFGANIPLQGGKYGNAILSRFPITRSRNYLLPNVGNGEQRGVLQATLSLDKSDKEIQVLATHFDHRQPGTERELSAEAVNQLAREIAEPAVLMGDLNAVANSQPLKILDDAWKRTNPKPLPTVPVAAPTRQIDFIFVRPQSRWNVIESRVLDEAIASDHRAIFNVVELRDGA